MTKFSACWLILLLWLQCGPAAPGTGGSTLERPDAAHSFPSENIPDIVTQADLRETGECGWQLFDPQGNAVETVSVGVVEPDFGICQQNSATSELPGPLTNGPRVCGSRHAQPNRSASGSSRLV